MCLADECMERGERWARNRSEFGVTRSCTAQRRACRRGTRARRIFAANRAFPSNPANLLASPRRFNWPRLMISVPPLFLFIPFRRSSIKLITRRWIWYLIRLVTRSFLKVSITLRNLEATVINPPGYITAFPLETFFLKLFSAKRLLCKDKSPTISLYLFKRWLHVNVDSRMIYQNIVTELLSNMKGGMSTDKLTIFT